jgi:drug/metabolite transporter (DMT)-like permease
MEGSIPQQPPARSFFFNPMFQLILAGILNASGELLLKVGANSTSPSTTLFGFSGLASLWTWSGIIAYIAALLSWLYVLRYMQLNVAFAVLNVLRLLVPIGAAAALHEHVSHKRWLGIALAFFGVFLILKPLMRAEEKL